MIFVGVLHRWIIVCGEDCESLSDDWFGNLSDTLEPSLWIHSLGLWVTLLLRLGTTMSTVGSNVLGLHPIGELFCLR